MIHERRRKLVAAILLSAFAPAPTLLLIACHDGAPPHAGGASSVMVDPPTSPIASDAGLVLQPDHDPSDAMSLATMLEVSAPDAAADPPPPPLVIPPPTPGLAKFLKVNVLEIHDEWDGLGATYDVFLRLERASPDAFSYSAKFARYPGLLGERVHDATAPRDKAFTCLCAIDLKCACERGSFDKKQGTVSSFAVSNFLGAVASHRIETHPKTRAAVFHTDDYPRGHTLFVVPGESAPTHLSFWTQERRWMLNGKNLNEEAQKEPNDFVGPQLLITQAYNRLLREIGVYAWAREARQERGLRAPLQR